jgi:hypothetical protein
MSAAAAAPSPLYDFTKEEGQKWNFGHAEPPPSPERRCLPDERLSATKKLQMGGWSVYITVGLYSNDLPGEVFVTCSKPGSVIRGDMDAWAKLFSWSLQRGVPLQELVDEFRDHHSDPNGWVMELGNCPSIHSAVVRWMEQRFLVGHG